MRTSDCATMRACVRAHACGQWDACAEPLGDCADTAAPRSSRASVRVGAQGLRGPGQRCGRSKSIMPFCCLTRGRVQAGGAARRGRSRACGCDGGAPALTRGGSEARGGGRSEGAGRLRSGSAVRVRYAEGDRLRLACACAQLEELHARLLDEAAKAERAQQEVKMLREVRRARTHASAHRPRAHRPSANQTRPSAGGPRFSAARKWEWAEVGAGLSGNGPEWERA